MNKYITNSTDHIIVHAKQIYDIKICRVNPDEFLRQFSVVHLQTSRPHVTTPGVFCTPVVLDGPRRNLNVIQYYSGKGRLLDWTKKFHHKL